MSMILNPTESDFCPCGGTKKWKKCHGAGFEQPPLQDDPNIDPVLLALAGNVLDLLKESIESLIVDDNQMEDAFRKRSLLYFANKIYRATLAGVTLIRTGQTRQAFTLKRDQHYAWVAFFYYFANEPQSVLFFASGPLRQRDKAEEITGFNPEAANDPKRQTQLAELKKLADFMYEKFPGLKVPKGKSGTTAHPIMQDWKEPDEFTMMKAIVETWPEEMAKAGNPVPEENREKWCRQQLLSAQFFHASFPSQDSHGTPMGLAGDLNSEDEEDTASTVTIGSQDPNSLLYIYLWYPIGVAEKLIELAGINGSKNRLVKIHKALHTYQEYFDRQ
jgi:hypothetical protein